MLLVDAPALRLLIAQPRHEGRHAARRDLGQLGGAEVGIDVLVELSAVFVAGALAEPAPPPAQVALDPRLGRLAQRHARALLELAMANVSLAAFARRASSSVRADSHFCLPFTR